MKTIWNFIKSQFHGLAYLSNPELGPNQRLIAFLVPFLWLATTLAIIFGALHAHAANAPGTSLPGTDASDQLEAAGILLKTLDTGIFKWGARLFAGLCIMSSAWALKEQRFGIAIICVVGAIIFGTAPKWVANIFDVGGNAGVFSQVENQFHVASIRGGQSYSELDHV